MGVDNKFLWDAGIEFAMAALHIVVIGPLNNAKTHELVAAILSRPLPNRFLTVMAPEDSFPAGHPPDVPGAPGD